MRLFFLALATFSATTLAQLPTNISFASLTSQYLPFTSLTTTYIANSTLASTQLASACTNPVTIFLSLDLAFLQFLATPPLTPASGLVEQAHYGNTESNEELLQYLQLDGVYKSSDFNGTSFVATRLRGVDGGAKLKVVRSEREFWIGSGVGLRSDVVIPDIVFTNGNGVIHIISHPAAPPYNLPDTATVLDNHFLTQLTSALPFLSNTTNVTVFAIQNSGLHDGMLQIAQYVVDGEVVYSSDLSVGRVLRNGAGGVLVVSGDGGGGVRVNGSRIVRGDVLVEGGVVHFTDRAFE